MTHKEKITYMRIATGMCGYGYTDEGIDLLVSVYDEICTKGGNTDIKGIAVIQAKVAEKYKVKTKKK